MKCRTCETEFNLKRKDIKRELKHKKNKTILLEETKFDGYEYHFLKGNKIKYKHIKVSLTCNKNIYNRYVTCPICDTRRYIHVARTPVLLSGEVENKDGWSP